MKNFDLKVLVSDVGLVEDSIVQCCKMQKFNEVCMVFLKVEKVCGVFFCSSWDGGLICVMGQNYCVGKIFLVLVLMLSVEYYNLFVCLLDSGVMLCIVFNVDVKFYDEDVNVNNIIVEIFGEGVRFEIVMFGVYLDLWYGVIGGVDNVVGVVIMMEVICILKVIYFSFKCIICIGLWIGEEQGLLGLVVYVEQYFVICLKLVDFKECELSCWLWSSFGWFVMLLLDYELLLVYFNVDNGSGKICGIVI